MPLRLSVNLSVQQLQHDRLARRRRGGADVVADCRRSYLDLEITESVIITHPERAVDTLVKLQQRGISITVDDFGTGYSSLSYLARLPIQSLKIDQRFVRGLEQNRSDETITQAIIALSHSLGLRVIAEGVETAAQFAFLKRLGCEEAQGYLISHPMEEPDFVIWWALQSPRRGSTATSTTCGRHAPTCDAAGACSAPSAAGRSRRSTSRRTPGSSTSMRSARVGPRRDDRAGRPRRRRARAAPAGNARPNPTGCPRRPS